MNYRENVRQCFMDLIRKISRLQEKELQDIIVIQNNLNEEVKNDFDYFIEVATQTNYFSYELLQIISTISDKYRICYHITANVIHISNS